MRKALFVLVAVALMVSLVACSPDVSMESSSPSAQESGTEVASESATGVAQSPSAQSGAMHITLITANQTDSHWVQMDAAAKAEVEKLRGEGNDILYEWLAPEGTDASVEAAQIDSAVQDGAQCIIIAATNASAANDALQKAMDSGVKIIYVDASADLEASAKFATDNIAAGELAGEELLAYLTQAGITSGQIGIVSAQRGVEAWENRVDGFKRVFEGKDYTTSDVQFSDDDVVKAQELARNLINDGCVALFGADEAATTGIANAVAEAKASGKEIVAVGCDNSSSNRALVRDGALLAFIAQQPDVMGRKAIDAAVDILQGKELESRDTDTGASVVTIDNVAEFEDNAG